MTAADAVQQLRALRSAASDNLQWTLAQVDSEFMRFRHALDGARLAAQDGALSADGLADLRKRFDIFYSRIDTFRATGTYSSLRRKPQFESAFGAVAGGLEQIGAQIDQPDAALTEGLDAVDAAAERLAPQVRDLSLMGLSEFAQHADDTRAEVTTTLARLAATTGVMFVAISLLAVALLRMYRLSERRAVQQMQTAARMQTVIQTALDGIILCDGAGRITDFSPAAETIFGYTATEARGRALLDLILPAGEAADDRGRLSAILRDPVPETLGRIDVSGQARDGRRFPAEVSIRLAEGGLGRIFVLFIRDISQLKQAEMALIAAHDRAVAGERAKADFVAVISHEIRTPLNGLLGNMSLLCDTRLSQRQRGYVQAMEVSGRLLAALVNDVLGIAKLEAGKMPVRARAFRLSQVHDEIVANQKQLALANGTTLGWSWVGAPRDRVLGDADKIRQVLMNFVSNAIKFTRDGTVHIEAEPLDDAAQVELRVRDTGEGIAPGDLERIFQDFEMLDSSYGRKPGTGLGLGISRRLAALMGGAIGVESRLHEGSLFWLRVPLQEAPQTDEAPGPAAAPEASAPLSVLIVEDNDINRAILREMLEACGHRVRAACDGRAGVDAAAAERFDVILMDISMPVMNGREAARAIRAGSGASCGARIVAVTAHALPEELDAFRAAGMDAVLIKPIDRDALRRILSGAAPAGAARFDPAHLCGADAEPAPQLRALLGRFLEQTDATMAALASGVPEEEEARLQALHRCAGAAGTFGATALHARLAEIETAAKRGDPAPLRAAASDLPPLWAERGPRSAPGSPLEPHDHRQRTRHIGDIGDRAVVAGDAVAGQQIGVVIVAVGTGHHILHAAGDDHGNPGLRIARQQRRRARSAGRQDPADAVRIDHRLQEAGPVGHFAAFAADGGDGIARRGRGQVRQEQRHSGRADRPRHHQRLLEAAARGHTDLIARNQHHVLVAGAVDRAAHVERIGGAAAQNLHRRQIRIRAHPARRAQRRRQVARLGGAAEGILAALVHRTCSCRPG